MSTFELNTQFLNIILRREISSSSHRQQNVI